MPSPPMTASLIVREPMPEPYWRVGPAVGVPGAAAAAPPLSRRSSATCTALMAGSGFPESAAERSYQGYMSYTRGAPDREPERDLRPALHPAAGGRPALDQVATGSRCGWLRVPNAA